MTSDLERELRELGGSIDYPEGDLAARIRAVIEEGSARRVRWLPARLAHPAFAATAAVVVACLVLIASPAARVAVADLLGIDGVRIEVGDRLPPAGAGLELGERVSLDEAWTRANFDVLVPSELGPPDEVYVADAAAVQVALVYRAGGELPPAVEGSRAGVVVTEFRARLEVDLYKKLLGEGTELDAVTVNGHDGFWIEGAPHVISYVGPGGPGRLPSRLVGNTLLWNQDGVVVRIESSLSRARSLALAASLR